MVRYAVIVGVEKYSYFQPTPFAHADSLLLYKTLTEHCDYAAQHTLLLNLDPSDDKKPSEILEKIQRTVEGSSIGDTVLFYFAGHGHFSEGKTYLILPGTVHGDYERTSLPIEDISKELRIPLRACFRVLDACHSGLDVRSDSNMPDSNSFVRAVTHDASGWVTLAACSENQYSVCDPQIGHGVFTHYLCEFIRNLKPDEPVLPELLKVGIVEKVCEHANRLGNAQTPTLNASISGNISLAIRRRDISQEKPSQTPVSGQSDLVTRIAKLREIPDMFEKRLLEKNLQFLMEMLRAEFEQNNDLGGTLSVGVPISADNIPSGMQPSVVNFVRRQGLQPRHEIVRWEDVYEEPIPMALVGYIQPRKRKSVDYNISQSSDLPNSSVVFEISGDNRCVPSIKVLLYVIPLQITTCILISSFRHDWPPYEKNLDLLNSSYKILRPHMALEETKTLVSLAVKNTMEKLQQCATNRITQLEKELQ